MMRSILVGLFILLAGSPHPAWADTHASNPTQDEKFVETSTRSLTIFARLRGLDLEQPSREFIGFQSKSGTESAQVEIFSRWNQFDAWVDGFSCKENISAVECLKTSGQPRCFYSPDTGRFSISDAIKAISLTLKFLETPPNAEAELRSLKFWQTGSALYGKIQTSAFEEDVRFLCAKSETNTLECGKYEHTRNEP